MQLIAMISHAKYYHLYKSLQKKKKGKKEKSVNLRLIPEFFLPESLYFSRVPAAFQGVNGCEGRLHKVLLHGKTLVFVTTAIVATVAKVESGSMINLASASSVKN